MGADGSRKVYPPRWVAEFAKQSEQPRRLATHVGVGVTWNVMILAERESSELHCRRHGDPMALHLPTPFERQVCQECGVDPCQLLKSAELINI
jgi:hypothetical protein